MTKDHRDVQFQIEKAINEDNFFWWGCVIGETRGKVEVIRVSEHGEVTDKAFRPIVRVKYGSPYRGENPKGEIIKYYENDESTRKDNKG